MTATVRRAPWIWLTVVAVASLGIFLVGGYVAQGAPNSLSAAAWLILPVIYTGLGAVISTRDPGNRIAWILFTVGVATLVDAAVQPLVIEPPVSMSFVDYLALFLSGSTWVFIFFPIFLLLYIFPTGRFLSRRWRWAGWLTGWMVMSFFVLAAFVETWTAPNEEWAIANPIGFIPESIWGGTFDLIWGLALIALPVGGVAALVVRFRHAATVERAQIKWILYAGMVFALAYIAGVVASEVLTADFGDLVIGNLFAISLALLPISMTAAIARYHLFAIDKVISRTVGYTIVITVLGGLYFGIVTLTTTLIPTQDSLAVAAATLAVAALFNPLRRRIQGVVDRRFNRSGYRAQIVSDQFATTLRASLDADQLTSEWARTVEQTLQPSAVGVWIKMPSERPGAPSATPDAPDRVV